MPIEVDPSAGATSPLLKAFTHGNSQTQLSNSPGTLCDNVYGD